MSRTCPYKMNRDIKHIPRRRFCLKPMHFYLWWAKKRLTVAFCVDVVILHISRPFLYCNDRKTRFYHMGRNKNLNLKRTKHWETSLLSIWWGSHYYLYFMAGATLKTTGLISNPSDKNVKRICRSPAPLSVIPIWASRALNFYRVLKRMSLQ